MLRVVTLVCLLLAVPVLAVLGSWLVFDAERLGAEVNAHTDKDHTAFHMRGLAQHATAFVRMLGASRRRVFAELHAPLLRRSALAAALLVFVDVMKELPATLLLRPFDSDTLAVVAYQLARDERLAEAALPSLAIVAVGLVPVLLLSRAIGRRDAD